MLCSLLLCGCLWLVTGYVHDDDWIDPTDMLNYDAASRTMRKPQFHDSEKQKSRFEDSFGVDLCYVFMVPLCLLCIMLLVASNLRTSVRHYTKVICSFLALGGTFTSLVMEPWKYIGKGTGQFITALMKETPVLYQVLLFIIVAVGVLGFCCSAGNSLHLLTSLGGPRREPYQGFQPGYRCPQEGNDFRPIGGADTETREVPQVSDLSETERREVLQMSDFLDAETREHPEVVSSAKGTGAAPGACSPPESSTAGSRPLELTSGREASGSADGSAAAGKAQLQTDAKASPEEGSSEEISSEEGSPEEGSPEEGSSEESSPEEGSPEEGSPEEGSPEEGSPEEGSPEEGSPEEGSPEEGSPEEGSPEEGSPEEGSPEEGSPEEGSPASPAAPAAGAAGGGDLPGGPCV